MKMEVKENKGVQEEERAKDIEKYCQEIIEKNKEAVKNYKEGGEEALDFLASKVMQKVKGKTRIKQDEQKIEYTDRPKAKRAKKNFLQLIGIKKVYSDLINQQELKSEKKEEGKNLEGEKRKEIEAVQEETNGIDKHFIEVLKENPQAVENYKKGQEGALDFLANKVLQKTKGKTRVNWDIDRIKQFIKLEEKRTKRNFLHLIGAYKTPSEIKELERKKKENRLKDIEKRRLHAIDIARKARLQQIRKKKFKQDIGKVEHFIKLEEKKAKRNFLHLIGLYKTPSEIEEIESKKKDEKLKEIEKLREETLEKARKIRIQKERENEKRDQIIKIRHNIKITYKRLLHSINLYKTPGEIKKEQEIKKEKERLQRLNLLRKQKGELIRKEKGKKRKQELKRKNKELMQKRISTLEKKTFDLFHNLGLLKTDEEKIQLKKQKEEKKKRKELEGKKLEEDKRKQKELEQQRKENLEKNKELEKKLLEQEKRKNEDKRIIEEIEKRRLETLEREERRKKSEEKMRLKELKISEKKIERGEGAKEKGKRVRKLRKKIYDLLYKLNIIKTEEEKLTKEQIEAIEQKLEESHKYRTADDFIRDLDKEGTIKLTKEQINSIERKIEESKKNRGEDTIWGN